MADNFIEIEDGNGGTLSISLGEPVSYNTINYSNTRTTSTRTTTEHINGLSSMNMDNNVARNNSQSTQQTRTQSNTPMRIRPLPEWKKQLLNDSNQTTVNTNFNSSNRIDRNVDNRGNNSRVDNTVNDRSENLPVVQNKSFSQSAKEFLKKMSKPLKKVAAVAIATIGIAGFASTVGEATNEQLEQNSQSISVELDDTKNEVESKTEETSVAEKENIETEEKDKIQESVTVENTTEATSESKVKSETQAATSVVKNTGSKVRSDTAASASQTKIVSKNTKVNATENYISNDASTSGGAVEVKKDENTTPQAIEVDVDSQDVVTTPQAVEFTINEESDKSGIANEESKGEEVQSEVSQADNISIVEESEQNNDTVHFSEAEEQSLIAFRDNELTSLLSEGINKNIVGTGNFSEMLPLTNTIAGRTYGHFIDGRIAKEGSETADTTSGVNSLAKIKWDNMISGSDGISLKDGLSEISLSDVKEIKEFVEGIKEQENLRIEKEAQENRENSEAEAFKSELKNLLEQGCLPGFHGTGKLSESKEINTNLARKTYTYFIDSMTEFEGLGNIEIPVGNNDLYTDMSTSMSKVKWDRIISGQGSDTLDQALDALPLDKIKEAKSAVEGFREQERVEEEQKRLEEEKVAELAEMRATLKEGLTKGYLNWNQVYPTDGTTLSELDVIRNGDPNKQLYAAFMDKVVENYGKNDPVNTANRWATIIRAQKEGNNFGLPAEVNLENALKMMPDSTIESLSSSIEKSKEYNNNQKQRQADSQDISK